MVDRGAWLVTVYGVTERVRHDLAAQQQQHMCIHTHTHTHSTGLVYWSAAQRFTPIQIVRTSTGVR